MIDASILAAWFLEDRTDPRVESAIDALARVGACAPVLLFFEIRNVLLISERRSRITESVATAFLRDLAQLRIRLEAPGDGLDVMSFARRRNLTVYDAAYLELARREALPLATLDRDLERAAIAEGVALFGA